ncbi:hypothetical protein CAP42_09610 [Acinetobacter indicus]|uniref:hypothetical protein n=1 Tax=Acinetobacter indicus TaxID=756892 RepID=UPI0005F8299E|nr:hypothetical protein [Acinetobacter indicus]KJV44346.1 hypothetical protein VH96_07900 [Acinetobacter indicus]OUY09686.1 hypothetical protein CAP42_09610 [Acinetobacter indicus]
MKYPVAILFLLASFNASADLADELEDLVGYTIVDSKTIKGWYDDEESEEGAFKGCKHGRTVVFTDNTTLTCSEYGYQYAYRPTAIILAKEITYQGQTLYDFKIIVEDEVYDMRR